METGCKAGLVVRVIVAREGKLVGFKVYIILWKDLAAVEIKLVAAETDSSGDLIKLAYVFPCLPP